MPSGRTNLGVNPRRGTLRGLHYQEAPDLEAKLVRCLKGSAWDVMVDLRPESPTFRHWHGVELSAENHRAVYIPPLCAHGYITLVDDTDLWYQATTPYAPSSARGVRHDDPAIGIEWSVRLNVIKLPRANAGDEHAPDIAPAVGIGIQPDDVGPHE